VRVACYGEVDELNAAIGLAVAALPKCAEREVLHAIQSDLFILGPSWPRARATSRNWRSRPRR